MADIVNFSAIPLYRTEGGTVYLNPSHTMLAFSDIINAAWNKGLESQAEFKTKLDAATDGFLNTTTAPHISAGMVSSPSISEPVVAIQNDATAANVLTMINSEAALLVADLETKFSTFRASFFPDDSLIYEAAEDWIQGAIANPNGAIPLAVQTQILAEDQARILDDATRATEALIAQFAARRFPLPPGALANASLQIQQKAQDEIAESSRKVAIMSVEQMKFAIEKAINARQMAMSSVLEYIKTIATQSETSSRMVGSGYDAQSKMISGAAAFFNARISASELVTKVAQFNVGNDLDAATKNQMSDLTLIDSKLKALLAEAELLARSATALFNNLHASASMTAQGSTVSDIPYTAPL